MIDRNFTQDIPVVKLDSLLSKDLFYDPLKKRKHTTFVENNKKTDIPIIIDYGSGITKAVYILSLFLMQN